MPKKTTILIAVLAVVTVILLFFAVTSGQKTPNEIFKPPQQTKKVAKTATVFFRPQNVDLSTSTTATVDVMVDSGPSEISGVQVEAEFDPSVISSVTLTPAADQSSFFGPGAVILLNEIKTTTGRVSYATAIDAGQAAKRGVGKIAGLTIQKAPGAQGTSTTINLLDSTAVTVLGESESVLKNATPLTITLTR